MDNKTRLLFPIFNLHKNLVYLDSAGTSLKPKTVIWAISDYYQKYSINHHSGSSNPLFSEVQAIIQQTRDLIAKRIGAEIEEIIFFPSATYSLNILALSLKDYLEKGDKVYLSRLEHSSNCYPWQAIAQEKVVQVGFLPLNEDFIIDTDKLENYIDQKTRIVSFSHVSNSLGVVNPVKEIAKKIKKINPDCLIIVDACQSIAHLPINVKEWGIDALVFSGHKAYGPTGIGVLWIKKELGGQIPDVLWGGGKKISPYEKRNGASSLTQKFEVGTLPLAQIFGLKASLEFFNSFDNKEISNYEKELTDYSIKELIKLKKITIYNQNLETFGIILFNLRGFHAHDVADYLGKNNICVRAGNFCCPYLKELIGVEAAIRISFLVYNTKKDIDKLVCCLEKLVENPNLIVNFLN
jgi:cysteine desulfurase / selenocysteine lyase